MTSPPPLPPDIIYTRCYCEENIYLLCQALLKAPSVTKLWDIFVVFISNINKTVAVRYQRAAQHPDYPIVWDYHVILVLRPRRKEHTRGGEQLQMQSWVYDFDTTLGLPHPWEEYFSMSFPENILPEYESLFRVVGGELYIQNFASDRSHMLIAEAVPNAPGGGKSNMVYSSQPPKYQPICGPLAAQNGVTNNLMQRYVNMLPTVALDHDTVKIYGVVLDRREISSFFFQLND